MNGRRSAPISRTGAEVDILAPRSLIALANHFRSTQVLFRPEASIRANAANLPDLAEIKSQESAKRALQVAAAGGHNQLILFTTDPVSNCRCAMVDETQEPDGRLI
ncbi:ATP-binding protein [Rhizobium leguminosarum]|uniref:ATP-binding protein n=1 Tax=Rhizobium leguminosarum TaxID=384 RepID=UPI0039655AEB